MRGATSSRNRFAVQQFLADHFDQNDDHDFTLSSSASQSLATSSEHELDEDALKEIWREYKRTGSRALRDMLVVHYMSGHVRLIARRLHAHLPRQVDVDDLVDEAYDGLVDVIERFDIDRDVRFETFSSQRIAGAMRDYLRKIDPVPRLARARAKLIQAATERFHKIHGRAPDQTELKQQVQILERRRIGRGARRNRTGTAVTDREFRRILKQANPASFVSFNGQGSDSDSEADAMGAFEDLRSLTPLTHTQRDDLRRWVTEGFARRDRLIIILYYYEHMTMHDIGRTIGCSESRVSQRLNSIVKCLRAKLKRAGGRFVFEIK